MSALSNWFWGQSQLDDAVDKATSELLPSGSEDMAMNLEICDQIRSKSAPPKDAMRALKRRLNHKNPNVQLLALGLTDICVKNGGDHFLVEIGSREFIDNLVSILKMPMLNHEVKNTILRFIQNWSISFEGKPSLSYVGQVYKTLKNEGFKFPPKDLTAASSAMVDTQTAPEWIDSDVCLRCRTAFTFTNRKHHCRNCGQVFDQQCSSKSIPLPHFGITQDVRVCDGCYSKLTKRGERSKSDKGHRHSHSMHSSSRHRNDRDFSDADLQRAIQLSLQEVGAAGGHNRPGYVPYQVSEPPIVDRSSRPSNPSLAEEDDPDLRAAIEASLREASAPKPSAPLAIETPRSEQVPYAPGAGYSQSYPPGVVPPHPAVPKIPTYDLEPLEEDAILTFSQTVEHVQSQGGRDISSYPAVNELYDKANGLRPKLVMSLDDAGRKEQMLSDMHDKLSQAVKLYDQLLSEQVAHPRWRSPQASAEPYQPQTNGYTQWAPQQNNQASEPQAQSSYFPAAPPRDSQSTPKPQYYQQSTYSEASQHTQQPFSVPVSQPYASVPSSSYQPHQPATVSSPPASLPQLHSPPTQYAAPPPQASPSLSRQNTVSYSYSHAHSPSPVNSTLARSNTIGARPEPNQQQQYQQQYSSQPQPQQAHQPPSQPQPQTQMQKLQQPYVASPPPAPTPVAPLPQFPIAPTSAPQAFPMYGSSIPTGIAQTEERKEALLIDL
ncbi:ubiquitin binding protein [Dendrothele bispora CBS 962.96]|uniref:Vacuolar protein sorting-associated protein 27 n=1 Tax=Dendrothele bispora (strain CBS 962.96) TaxID=1314807 RepID=A0A4S8MF39_DENBC|nr:ubiquitin binding protein [Dendrothele bispora CBS 962.96]